MSKHKERFTGTFKSSNTATSRWWCKGCRIKNVPFSILPIARSLMNQKKYVIRHLFHLSFIFKEISVSFLYLWYFLRLVQICLIGQKVDSASDLAFLTCKVFKKIDFSSQKYQIPCIFLSNFAPCKLKIFCDKVI